MIATMKWVIRIVLIVLAGALLFAGNLFYRIGLHRQLQMFLPPVLDEHPPALPAELGAPAVLVFSKTNGFRHHEAIPAGNEALRIIAAAEGFGVFVTENGAVFEPALLDRFEVVVWNNVSGEVLIETQRAALRTFIENGGGFLGIHAAGDGSHQAWPWYVDEIIRAHFSQHPRRQQFQAATLYVDDPAHPVTAGLPSPWQRRDEWYSFEQSPRPQVNVLITIDEATYDPENVPMGDDHPLVWAHSVGTGRIVYSAMGHTAESFAEPDNLTLLSNALRWAANIKLE